MSENYTHTENHISNHGSEHGSAYGTEPSPKKRGFSLWGFIKGIGKFILGFLTIVQGLIALVLLLVIFSVITSINNVSSKSKAEANLAIADGSAFLLNPSGVLVELAPESDPLSQLMGEAYGIEQPSPIALNDVVRTIRSAKDDTRIKAMVLDIDSLAISGSSKIYTLINELEAFKESGKKIYSISDFYSQSQYLLASHADEIYLNEMGAVSLTGYGSYQNYYKSLLEKLKITTHVFRVGTYKAAVEPQLRDDMSPEAKEANFELISAFWERYKGDVAVARNISPETIHNYADKYNEVMRQYGGDSAKAARETGLVDKTYKSTDIKNFLQETFGKGKNKKGFKNVNYRKYLASLPAQTASQKDRIAIITAAGVIVPGRGVEGSNAGSTTIVNYLNKARDDDKVKAVVLRVDSPGGSAFASELMHNAIEEVQAKGKPVIVSMGSLAASGGYLIAAPADEIWASPTTITGSIGIFATFNTFENLADEIGYYTDGVGTTSQSSLNAAFTNGLPAVTADAIQLGVENGYDRFLTIVANGRGLDKTYVDSVGQGRVWTGERALELKLVDKIGNLDDAVKAAANRANLTEYDVTRYEDRRTAFERLFNTSSAQIIGATGLHKTIARHQQSGLGQIIKAIDTHAEFLTSFEDPNNLHMRCLPCEATVKN